MTRLLVDPATDFDDPTAVTITATLLDPGPAIVRTFTGVTAATVVDLSAPGTAEAWRLTVRRPTTTLNRWNIASTNPGPIVEERTVHFTGSGPVAWAALTDVDPATLRTTATPGPAWDAAIAELRAELDHLPAGGGGEGTSLIDNGDGTFTGGPVTGYTKDRADYLLAGKDSAGAGASAQSFATQRGNHTGTQSADTITDGTTNKAFTAGERIKLAAIAPGATANRADTATDAAIAAATAALVNAAPSTLDTLGELAAALQADESAAATLSTLVGTKAPLASPEFTGAPTIGGAAIARTTDIAAAVAAQATADAATYATKPQALTAGLTLMGLGDSITYNGGNDLVNKFQTVGDFFFTDKSWHLYAQILSGGKFQHLGNGALGGYTIEQVRDTWLPAVLAVRPALCTVLAGQNNLGTLTDANLAALGDIYDQLLAAGIVPVLCTNPATETSTNLFRLNAWVRRQSRERGLPLADLYAATVDPATGRYRAGYSSDGVHPVAAGAMAMGQALADTLTPYLRAGSADLAQSEGGYFGVVPGPLFLTDNGANPPSPTAGWTPLTTYQPGDFSYTTNPAGPGRMFTVARRTGGVDNHIRADLGTPSAGDTLRWATRITVTVPAGGSVTLDFQDQQATSVLAVTFTRSITGVINLERPARVTAPHYLDVKVDGVDGASVGLAQFSFQNLSTLGAD